MKRAVFKGFPEQPFSTIMLLLFTIVFFNARAQHTLTLQPNGTCGKDAILHGLDYERNVNFGDNPQLPAVAWTFNGTPGNVRGLVEFDLNNIPPGTIVTGAYLSLYAWGQNTGLGPHASLSGSDLGWIQRVTSPWDEHTVTWDNQPSTTTVNQVVLPESTAPDEDCLVDVTILVQDMLNDPSSSYGFLIREQVEEYYRRLNFYSSDSPDPSKRPKLVITCMGGSSSWQGVNLGPDAQICPGQTVNLNAFMAQGTYLWQNGSTAPVFQVTQPGTYWVQVSTCSIVYTDTIVISPGDCSGQPIPTEPEFILLEMPNVFTPGSDQLNDVFTPVSSSGIASMHTTILNRWGQKLFESDDSAIGWKGDFNGNPVSAGVYFWIVEYIGSNGISVTQHGYVTIIR